MWAPRRREEKDLFKEYMEDYNTATLPSKKYYNYEAFLLQEQAEAARGKGPVVAEERTTFNDEEERKVRGRRPAESANRSSCDERRARRRPLSGLAQ